MKIAVRNWFHFTSNRLDLQSCTTCPLWKWITALERDGNYDEK